MVIGGSVEAKAMRVQVMDASLALVMIGVLVITQTLDMIRALVITKALVEA